VIYQQIISKKKLLKVHFNNLDIVLPNRFVRNFYRTKT